MWPDGRSSGASPGKWPSDSFCGPTRASLRPLLGLVNERFYGSSEGKVVEADLRVAVSRTRDQKPSFPVSVFGKLAGTCDIVKKGAKVLVDGQVDIAECSEKEGQKRITFSILGDTYRLP